MKDSNIEWTDHTANFWWGCHKVSAGCQNCYAEAWANRWGKSIWGPPKTTSREYKKAAWKDVLKWNKQAGDQGVRYRVFVQSMSDFFEDHPQVTEWRRDALDLMDRCRNLDFQVLTKRSENIIRMIESGTGRHVDAWLSDNNHVWIGTSVENQAAADERIPHLLQVPAAVRFLSCEPLLGPVSLDRWFGLQPGNRWAECLCDEIDPADRPCITCEARRALGEKSGIHWVIVGGESGTKARPMHPDWARSIRDQCQNAGVPFFFKQWGEHYPAGQFSNMPEIAPSKPISVTTIAYDGGRVDFWRVGKRASGRLLDGREWNEVPSSCYRAEERMNEE